MVHERLASLGRGFQHFVDAFSAVGTGELLHNLSGDIDDIDSFIWYLNLHPAEFVAFSISAPSDEKWRCVAGVAAVARAYECIEILRWAVDFVLKDLELHRSFSPSAHTLTTLHQATDPTSNLTIDIALDWKRRVQEIWCHSVTLATNPASTLVAAQDLQDNFIIAHIYFHMLALGVSYITGLGFLSLDDRRRLLFGAFELSRRGVNLGIQPHTRNGPSSDSTSITGASDSQGGMNSKHNASKNDPHAKDRMTPTATDCVQAETVESWDRPFTALVDNRIENIRHELVEIFFQQPWSLD